MLTRVCPGLALVAPTVFMASCLESVSVLNTGSTSSLNGSDALSFRKLKIINSTQHQQDLAERVKAHQENGVPFGDQIYNLLMANGLAKKGWGYSFLGGIYALDAFYIEASKFSITVGPSINEDFTAESRPIFAPSPIITSESLQKSKLQEDLILYHCEIAGQEGGSIAGDSDHVPYMLWASFDPNWFFTWGCEHRVEITVPKDSAKFIGLIAADKYTRYAYTDEHQKLLGLRYGYEAKDYKNKNGDPEFLQASKLKKGYAYSTIVLPPFSYKYRADQQFIGPIEITSYDGFGNSIVKTITKTTKITYDEFLDTKVSQSWLQVANRKQTAEATSSSKKLGYQLQEYDWKKLVEEKVDEKITLPEAEVRLNEFNDASNKLQAALDKLAAGEGNEDVLVFFDAFSTDEIDQKALDFHRRYDTKFRNNYDVPGVEDAWVRFENILVSIYEYDLECSSSC